jgi:hypothetical protein
LSMAYTPSNETRQHLADLYEMTGSYQKVADSLNAGRRQKDFTAYQVRRMLNTERVAHGEIQPDPIPVNLTQAQQRSLQRKTKVEGQTYERSYETYRGFRGTETERERNRRRAEKTSEGIQRRINDKLTDLQSQLRTARKGGDNAEAERLTGEIRRYQGFNDNLRKAKADAENFQEWKGIREKIS